MGDPGEVGRYFHCDAHNYSTYSRCAFAWHAFWVHIIGF